MNQQFNNVNKQKADNVRFEKEAESYCSIVVTVHANQRLDKSADHKYAKADNPCQYRACSYCVFDATVYAVH